MHAPRTPLAGTLTVVRPATPADADLLTGWHADPGVAEFWEGETFTREEVLVRLARADVDAYIIEAADDPRIGVSGAEGRGGIECALGQVSHQDRPA